MEKTVVAIYDNREDAQKAIRDLADNQFDRLNISLVTANPRGSVRDWGVEDIAPGMIRPSQESDMSETRRDTVDIEKMTGAENRTDLGSIGTILNGLGALAIPEIGPVLVGGPLAAALGGVSGAGSGTSPGSAVGGIVDALTNMGLSGDYAGAYAEGIRRGGTLVTMRVSDLRTKDARTILDQYHPVDINERVSQWRKSGWEGFFPDDQAATRQDDTNLMPGERSGTMENQHYGEPSDSSEGMQTGPAFQDNLSRPSSGMHSPEMEAIPPFDTFESHFRDHYVDHFSDRGYGYNQYLPAYRLGYDLANNEAYFRKEWDQVEPRAQNYWDERHPGTWPDFHDAVQYAWSMVRRQGWEGLGS